MIEAYQFDNRITNPPPHWLRKAVDVGDVTVFVHRGKAEQMTIRTLEGDMTAMPGDWIIQGVKGEIYPCKPDIFDATYDPAASPAQEVDETERLREALRKIDKWCCPVLCTNCADNRETARAALAPEGDAR